MMKDYGVSEELLGQLTPKEREAWESAHDAMVSEKGAPKVVVRRFSGLAFSLAMRSKDSGAALEVAVALAKVFNTYLDAHSDVLKTVAKFEISDIKVDLIYAGGNHNIMSSRLSMM